MKIKTPVHLSLDGNAVLKEAVARLAHANPAMRQGSLLRRSASC